MALDERAPLESLDHFPAIIYPLPSHTEYGRRAIPEECLAGTGDVLGLRHSGLPSTLGLQSAQALGALRATKSPRRALAPVDSRSLLTTSRPNSATFGQILLHGFVEVVVHGFLKVITCICQGRLPPDFQKEETKFCNFRSNPSVTV